MTAGADGRDHARIRKFLSQHTKKLPWKPEVVQIICPPFYLM